MIAEQYIYLLVDAGCLLVPFIASFHPKTDFYRHWRFFALPCLAVALFFIAWDILFTQAGIWGFNPRYLTGLYLYNLPLEEVGFFIAIPYACVFTYFCVRKFVTLPAGDKWLRLGILLGAVLLLALAVIHYQKLYTTVTFTLLSLLLLIVYRMRPSFLPHFFLSYIIILLPFFVSNGILTGSFTDEPIVWYHNAHHLGLRMGTIPLEDAFYAMLMHLLNIAGYEYMLTRQVTAGPGKTVTA